MAQPRKPTQDRVRGKFTETKLQIIQIDQDMRTEVTKDLREVQGRKPS
jgi:HlyD family secretion protein